jgi:hypothetical protein
MRGSFAIIYFIVIARFMRATQFQGKRRWVARTSRAMTGEMFGTSTRRPHPEPFILGPSKDEGHYRALRRGNRADPASYAAGDRAFAQAEP